MFASTPPHRDVLQHSAYTSVSLGTPTDDPGEIAKAAIGALLPLIHPAAGYLNAGVILSGLTPKESHGWLRGFAPAFEDRGLGELIDQVAARHGRTAIGIGLSGLKRISPAG